MLQPNQVPQDSLGTRLGMLDSGFNDWLNTPSFGIPVLGHFMGIPPAITGTLASMSPTITPAGSPAFNEAAMAGPYQSWNDRQDINPFVKIGAETVTGLTTGEPLNGILGSLARMAGLGQAANYIFPQGLASLGSLPVSLSTLDPMIDLGTAALRQNNRNSDDDTWANKWSTLNQTVNP